MGCRSRDSRCCCYGGNDSLVLQQLPLGSDSLQVQNDYRQNCSLHSLLLLLLDSRRVYGSINQIVQLNPLRDLFFPERQVIELGKRRLW